jgi:DNA-binding transcriptional MocR family regulator
MAVRSPALETRWMSPGGAKFVQRGDLDRHLRRARRGYRRRRDALIAALRHQLPD